MKKIYIFLFLLVALLLTSACLSGAPASSSTPTETPTTLVPATTLAPEEQVFVMPDGFELTEMLLPMGSKVENGVLSLPSNTTYLGQGKFQVVYEPLTEEEVDEMVDLFFPPMENAPTPNATMEAFFATYPGHGKTIFEWARSGKQIPDIPGNLDEALDWAEKGEHGWFADNFDKCEYQPVINYFRVMSLFDYAVEDDGKKMVDIPKPIVMETLGGPSGTSGNIYMPEDDLLGLLMNRFMMGTIVPCNDNGVLALSDYGLTDIMNELANMPSKY